MDEKIRVGILGATGMVGQKYVTLLENHPWFEVTYLAASERSAGRPYGEAVAGRWHMDKDVPAKASGINVANAACAEGALSECQMVFSAVEMGKDETRALENLYASIGIPVVSNASAHRWTEDVPMIIPEVNYHHAGIIPAQQKRNGWDKGFVAVKPNCSIQSYITPVYALMRAGYEVRRIMVTTMQAVSGAGYPGVASWDILGNVVPYIGGEEEKTEKEPLKILGNIKDGRIVPAENLKISAHCNRVPVRDGHMACVSLEFGQNKPSLQDIVGIWDGFGSYPQEKMLPSAPSRPIVYNDNPNRPQPVVDAYAQNGMAVTVGRLRKCECLDVKFVGLSHNTVRGAAGGGILNAELLKEMGYLDFLRRK